MRYLVSGKNTVSWNRWQEGFRGFQSNQTTGICYTVAMGVYIHEIMLNCFRLSSFLHKYRKYFGHTYKFILCALFVFVFQKLNGNLDSEQTSQEELFSYRLPEQTYETILLEKSIIHMSFGNFVWGGLFIKYKYTQTTFPSSVPSLVCIAHMDHHKGHLY